MAYAASGDLIPLYPLYALLFAQSGLDGAQISSLFVVWSVASLLLEVPSGALADRLPRRRVLAAAAVVNGAGYALWLVAPGYPGFLVGFVLWGLAGALASGTFEALVHDELAAGGVAHRYAQVSGWATSAGLVAMMLATLAAAPLVAAGGIGLAGWVSVGVCAAQCGVALTLPPATRVEGEEGSAAEPGYLALLRAGVREATARVVVRRLVLLTAGLYGLLALDEYFGLVFDELGAATASVALLTAVTAAGQAVAGLLAGRVARAPGPVLAGLTALGALGLAAAVQLGPWPAAVGIAVGYGLLQLVLVVTEARLQDAIDGPARATVTSVAGLGSEVLAAGLYVGFGVGSLWLGWAPLLALASVVPLLLAGVMARWLRGSPGSRRG